MIQSSSITSSRVFRLLTVALCAGGSALLAAPPTAPDSPEFFETRIRPVLANQCYGCHTNSSLGGLRVDSRDALLKGGSSGPALTPKDPEKSLLILAVQQTSDLKMPKGGKLKQENIDDLVAWVKAGAVWPNTGTVAKQTSGKEYVITPEQKAFWSFQPLKPVPPPKVKYEKWAQTDIDRFVLANLEREKLTPVRQADRRTLIRRATLDLTGLPATPKEIEEFEKDKSPDAFAKVVDRLLASPHYGERWGRLWLDVARYGEDDYRSLDPMGRGYNPYPNAFLYRDWVIQAFNNDIPFDQFVKSQLAADLLKDENTKLKTLPALGFLGLGPWYYDNGAVEVTRADERHDRVDVVTRGFLGMTVACARCHDHKYDPIPQKDYYSLAGVFASTSYHEYARAPKSIVSEYDAQEKRIKSKEKLLGEIQQAESVQLSETLVLQSSKYMQAAWRITGEPKEEIPKVVEAQKLDYELMERWVKFLAKPPKFYPYLEKWQAMIKRGGTAGEAKKLADEFQALLVSVMFERREMKEENEIIVAKSLPGTKKKERANKPNEFITNDDFCPGCGLELKTLPLERMNLWTDVFQRELTDEDPMQNFRNLKPGLLMFRGWGLERQLGAEKRAYIDALRTDIETARKALPPQYPYLHAVMDEPKPVDLPVSLRGNPYNLGEIQKRHFLTILSDGHPEAFARGSGRVELAEAIIRQPIAMRVYVNRIWKNHFGTGIVDTPSNFGFSGERPSNPELLEYLADYFVKNGMSTKKLHREIMLSSVYQLSADDQRENYAKDSANRLYWRANRHRMDSEEIRDSLLAVSGSLDEKLYGPSADLTPDYKRRTVYGKVSRYHLDEYLQLFDFPSPNISAEKRFATNVPLQRLFFMNSDFVQQQGELLAKRVADEPTNTARIQKMYSILYGRSAKPEEVAAGLEYLHSEPMREYEERKAVKEKKREHGPKPEAGDKPKIEEAEKAEKATVKGGAPEPKEEASDEKPAMEAATGEDKPEEMPMGMGMGMMAGMMGRRGAPPAAEKKPMLPVTVWGRYAKILLSSAEFTFID